MRPPGWAWSAGTAPLRDKTTHSSAAPVAADKPRCLQHPAELQSVHQRLHRQGRWDRQTEGQTGCSRAGGAIAPGEPSPHRVQPGRETWEPSSRSSPLLTTNRSLAPLRFTRVSGDDEQVMKSRRLFPPKHSWAPDVLKSLQPFPPVLLFLTPPRTYLQTMAIQKNIFF